MPARIGNPASPQGVGLFSAGWISAAIFNQFFYSGNTRIFQIFASVAKPLFSVLACTNGYETRVVTRKI
jgi:hypothetical protein